MPTEAEVETALKVAAVPLFLGFYEQECTDLVETLTRRLYPLLPPSARNLDEFLALARTVLGNGPHRRVVEESEAILRRWELEDPEGVRAHWDGTAPFVPWEETPADRYSELFDLIVYELLREEFEACAQELGLPNTQETLKTVVHAILFTETTRNTGRYPWWSLLAEWTTDDSIWDDHREWKFVFEAEDWQFSNESLEEAEQRIHAAFRTQLSAWRDAHRSRLFRPTRDTLTSAQQKTVRDLRWLAQKQSGRSYGQIAMREKVKPGTVRSAVLRAAKLVGLEEVRTKQPGRPRKR